MMQAWVVPVLLSAAGLLFGRGQAARPGELIEPASLVRADLVKYWQVDLPRWRGEHYIRLSLQDENLYCVTDAGAVVAVKAATGVIRWVAQVAETGDAILGPRHGGGKAYFVTADRVHVYDRISGQPEEALELGFATAGPAVADEQRLYVAGLDGRLRCVRLSDRLGLWEVGTAQPVVAAPALRQGKLFFASRDGAIYACRAADKVRLWQAGVEGQVVADLGVGGDFVLVPSTNGSLYCLEAADGSLRWRFWTPGQLLSGPVATGEHAYQYSRGYGLYAIELGSGRQRWHRQDGRWFLAERDGLAYVLTNLRQIVVMSNRTGREVCRIDAGRIELAVSNATDAAIYVASRSGRLMCIRPRGVAYLRLAQVSRALQAGLRPQRAATRPGPEAPPSGPKPKGLGELLRGDATRPAVGGYGLLRSSGTSERQ